jgi:hypothetical protein
MVPIATPLNTELGLPSATAAGLLVLSAQDDNNDGANAAAPIAANDLPKKARLDLSMILSIKKTAAY